ncbi:hypothetical protein [Nonomuraea rubra]|uniref:Uncharacterized protein n=1 Tax=Nonomuraea rubra TaxID=46180 RepID=A0A7X0U0Y9_9ACTN|nr:hypothetical protein [Nonomuraea rubra]MBB6550889.1 hypothetical protein [Nonomuraea rubra]
MDEAERQLLAELAARTAGLVTNLQRERDRLRAAGENTAWLDRMLHETKPLAAATHDLVIFGAIRAVIERHGGGPYPAEDLAALAGVSVEDAQRVLEQMVRHGLATPPGGKPPGAPPS